MERSSVKVENADVTTPVFKYEDPLRPDASTDESVETTRRALTRLAIVAAQVGARFEREAIDYDPVAWMLTPRRIFDGGAALEACLDRGHCLRATVLHGLSIGLDAEPSAIDALLCDHPGDDEGGFWDGDRVRLPGQIKVRRLRLYSAVLVLARGGELMHIFHASVAPSAATVRERIRSRFGSAAAAQAEILIGVDLHCPDTAGLIPPAFRQMIERGRRIRWSSMQGLDVTVEHRIPC